MGTINRSKVALGKILTLSRYQGVLVEQGRNATTERPQNSGGGYWRIALALPVS